MNRSLRWPASGLKILIVEDDAATRLMLTTLAHQLGHAVVAAEDGRTAVKLFAAEQPDVVLMDMLMPGMDGNQTMLEIRAITRDRWVPILFVTVASEVDLHVNALAQGADDYLIKPVHEDVLRAKLEVTRRSISLHRQIEDKNRELQSYRDAAENEVRVVKHLLARLVHQDKLSDPMLEHCILPADNFSGDLVTAARTPRGVLHVMLADGAGHGLAAALNVLPITPSFYAMTAKGLDIELIAVTLNSTIRQQLPRDRFVATTLIAVDFAARRVKIWNGGNPPLLALNTGGEVFARFGSRNLALGIVGVESFAPAFEVFEYTKPCQLFGYSDGVVESYDIPGETGEPSGQAAVEALLRGVPPNVRMKLLRNQLVARNDEQRAHDDRTLLLVKCGVDLEPIT
jgi:CheY-like chemotaxis protein